MINFLFFKYLSLFLNGCRSLALAKLLGPSEFGVYGSLITVQQYLSYFGLGVRESVVLTLAETSEENKYKFAICSSGLAWSFFVGVFLLIVGSFLALQKILDFNCFLVIIIGVLSILNEILVNIARSFNLLKAVGLYEVFYNLPPLICIFIFFDKTNIQIILESLVIGLLISVSGYFILLKPWKTWVPSKNLLIKLVCLGIPLAINSAISLSLNSIYILFANYEYDLKYVGKICLSLNICAFLYYALNSYAWARTSRSMALQAKSNETVDKKMSIVFFDNLFQLGIVALSLVACGVSWSFNYLMLEYKDSGKFLILFVLLQSYNFINFNNLNKFIINNKTYQIVFCYFGLLLALSILWFSKTITDLKTIIYCAIILNFFISVLFNYVSKKNANSRPIKKKITKVFFAYPIVAATGFMCFGELWVFIISFYLLFVLFPIVFNKSKLRDSCNLMPSAKQK